ncbi:cupin domain-containing protein [Pelagerythrobacter sp.]|uniref:cupin domain-containing protein n=1 Tax=Pelagerythrobacter sp. TaxID=2800702 RepID=UPI0035B4CB09
MRPRIVNLDVDSLEWKPLGPPGLYSRELSRDPETGARTALQRLSPADRYEPPKVAHYHHTYEEIIGISGCFSFDSRIWVTPGTYVFHPPETVHGFKSAIREESTFLSRVGRDLDFNFVEQPEQDDLYCVAETAPPRQPVVHKSEDNTASMIPGELLGDRVRARILSTHPETGEGSALVELPAGWTSRTAHLGCYLEIFMMSGGIAVDGNAPVKGRGYFFFPPGSEIGKLCANEPSLAYVNFGGDIGL